MVVPYLTHISLVHAFDKALIHEFQIRRIKTLKFDVRHGSYNILA